MVGVRLTRDHLDGVVVAVLVRHEQQVRRMRLDRRVLESDPRSHLGWERADGVDDNGVLRTGKRVGGLAVPADDHDVKIRFLRSITRII